MIKRKMKTFREHLKEDKSNKCCNVQTSNAVEDLTLNTTIRKTKEV